MHHDEQMQLLKLLANVVVGIDSKMNALDAKVDTALQRLDKVMMITNRWTISHNN